MATLRTANVRPAVLERSALGEGEQRDVHRDHPDAAGHAVAHGRLDDDEDGEARRLRARPRPRCVKT